MGKLVESTFVTLDGVISEPAAWGSPYWNDEHAGYAQKVMAPADALLLGRVTYDGFSKAWPARSGDPYTDKINGMPKFVASNTLRDPTWNATVISGDVAAEVAKLKEDPARNLLKFGTGEFSRTLLQHRLVDEYHFWMFPVVAGSGDRLFGGLDAVAHLKLIDTTTFSTGIVVMVLEPK